MEGCFVTMCSTILSNISCRYLSLSCDAIFFKGFFSLLAATWTGFAFWSDETSSMTAIEGCFVTSSSTILSSMSCKLLFPSCDAIFFKGFFIALAATLTGFAFWIAAMRSMREREGCFLMICWKILFSSSGIFPSPSTVANLWFSFVSKISFTVWQQMSGSISALSLVGAVWPAWLWVCTTPVSISLTGWVCYEFNMYSLYSF